MGQISYLATIAICACTFMSFTRMNGQVGINTTTPDANAILDIVSTNKGVLIPRLSQAQVNTLAALIPADGTLVYNSALQCIQIFKRSSPTAGSFDCLVVSGGADTTNDAWVNDNTNSQVLLGTQSDGVTARTAGTEFVAKNSGDTGIGTSSPTARLDVRTGNTGNFLRIANYLAPSNTTAGSASMISMGTSSAFKNEVQLRYVHQTDGGDTNRFDIGWNGLTVPAVSVLASGNVGIGTTNPAWQLDVQGSAATGHFKRFTGSLANNVAPTLLLTRSRGTATSPSSIVAGDFLGKLQFRGFTGSSDVDYGVLTYIANSTTAEDGRFSFLKGAVGGSANELLTINTNSGNAGIGTTDPTARLDLVPAANTNAGLRIRNLSNSRDKEASSISYTTQNNAPLWADNNGYVYKKYNPVLSGSGSLSFDGSYNIGYTSANATTLVSSLNDGSIIRFQIYIGSLLLGQSGIGSNLYADITYGYGGGGFRVSTYASEAGGNSTNTLSVTGEGTQTITFTFANPSSRNLVITNSGNNQNGPIVAYYTTSENSGGIVADIFQSFRSR